MTSPSVKSAGQSRAADFLHPPQADEALPAVPEATLRSHVAEVVSFELCRQVAQEIPRLGRQRSLTIDVMMIAMVGLVVRQFASLAELVDRLRAGLVDGVPVVCVRPQAVYKRLQHLPHTVFLALFQTVTRQLERTSPERRRNLRDWAPFATRIFALDDSTLDAVVRKTTHLKKFPKGAPETLAGRISCLIDLETGRFSQVLFDSNSAANEKTHFVPLIENQPASCLFIFDRGYFSFPLYDFLTGHYQFFLTRMRDKASFTVLRTLAEGPFYRDRLVWLGAYRADKAAYPVRLVELFVKGQWRGYLTNMLNPELLPAASLWALYQQRWSIEMAFAAVKRALGLAFLHVTHANGVLIQLWSTLTVYQLLQSLRLRIANAHHWSEDDVSWQTLVRRIGWYAERPDSRRALPEWLIEEAPRLSLQKRGVRRKRLTDLPKDVLRECSPPPPLGPITDLPPPRAPRQGKRSKPSPRSSPGQLVSASLS
jgi:Transposase DDE domain